MLDAIEMIWSIINVQWILYEPVPQENRILYTPNFYIPNVGNLFLPLLRHFNPAEPVVEKSVIL